MQDPDAIEWTFEDVRDDRLATWTRGDVHAGVRGNRWTGAGWQISIAGSIVCRGQCQDAKAFETAIALIELALRKILPERSVTPTMETENKVVIGPDRRYYVDQHSDETMPCDGTLAAWAEWFSKPDPEWRRPEAAQDGERFTAGVLRYEEDVVATRDGDRWTFSREIGDASFLAVRWSEGSGWSADNIVRGEDMTEALREWFAENNHLCDDREFVAIGFHEPQTVLTYRAGPPARMDIDVLQ